MNDEQRELARRMAAHPRFELRAGMLLISGDEHTPVARVLDIGDKWVWFACGGSIGPCEPSEAIGEGDHPDLTDAATGGVLLDMLGPGWTVITRSGKVDAHPTGCAGPPAVSGATMAEACARLMLAKWGATASTPETT